MTKKNSGKYTLSYTRDRQIITQHGWFYGNTKGIEKLLNKKFNNGIPMVLYYNHGPIEIWDNVKAIDEIKQEVAEKNKQDENFCRGAIDIFNKVEDDFFKPRWENKFTKNQEELKEVVEKFYEMCPYYVFIYYSLLTNSAPKKFKKDVETWKEQDAFFENTGRYIEESLKNIYPELKLLVNYIKIEEINNPPAKDILEKRKENYITVPGFFDEIITLDEFTKKHKESAFLKQEAIKTSLLKGETANGGKVTGRVRLLKTRENMDNVLDGEIIVSSMTTPEFLPAMKKAAAFITDEGGLLSHAAIVARELKKPCIVGTKIATKILKDGDLVEVDANKGVVKILNK